MRTRSPGASLWLPNGGPHTARRSRGTAAFAVLATSGALGPLRCRMQTASKDYPTEEAHHSVTLFTKQFGQLLLATLKVGTIPDVAQR